MIYYESAAVRAGHWEDLLFEVWLKPGNADDLRAMGDYQKRAARSSAGRMFVTCTSIRLDGILAVNDEMRAIIADTQKALRGSMKANAIIMATSGFAAAVVRGILAGVMLTRGSSPPYKIFASLEDAAPWVASQMSPIRGRPVTASMVVAVHQLLDSPG